MSEKLGFDLSGEAPADPMEEFYDAKPKKASATPQPGLGLEDDLTAQEELEPITEGPEGGETGHADVQEEVVEVEIDLLET